MRVSRSERQETNGPKKVEHSVYQKVEPASDRRNRCKPQRSQPAHLLSFLFKPSVAQEGGTSAQSAQPSWPRGFRERASVKLLTRNPGSGNADTDQSATLLTDSKTKPCTPLKKLLVNGGQV
jgi:hypothetical protein